MWAEWPVALLSMGGESAPNSELQDPSSGAPLVGAQHRALSMRLTCARLLPHRQTGVNYTQRTVCYKPLNARCEAPVSRQAPPPGRDYGDYGHSGKLGIILVPWDLQQGL